MFVTCHLPYPPYSGGRRREFELLRRVGRDFDVTVAAVSKVYEEDSANAPALKPFCRDVFVFAAQPEASSHPEPAQIVRHRCPELGAYVARAVASGSFELVHAEGFYVMQHLPDPCPVPVLLVEQNVEYVLWRQRAETAPRKADRDTAIAEYLRTLEAEVASWGRADLCGALTRADAAIMTSALPGLEVRLVPDGVEHVAARATVGSAPQGRVVAFAANFAYQPNVDAALYLSREVWPRVLRRVPDARLLLVGNAPPAEVRALDGRHAVVVTGRVPSIDPFLAKASVVVCPLRIGGGIKVKMLEAMSAGKAIATTSVGAQGLEHLAGKAFVVEDHPAELAHAVASLLTDEPTRLALEQEARLAAQRLPTWDDAARALGACYRHLVRVRGRIGART